MEPGTVIAGKFLLEQKLAEGGMGSVWVARHLQLGMHVALKFMAPALTGSAQLRSRFEREARAVALLQSPHVVRVLDFGVDGELPYLAMELLRGETLGARLKRKRRLPFPALAPIVQQCARALRRAHEAGVVHRDLKPQNIFLAVEDEYEVVKVLDFGVAKVLGGSTNETTTGTLLGSPLYMSPEQVRRGREVDHRTDLWSLGIVVYRALTGKLPYSGDEMGDIMVRICTEPIPRPSSIAPDLGPSVDAFFDRALAREPGDRFQSAVDFGHAFSTLARMHGAMSAEESRVLRTSEAPPPAMIGGGTPVPFGEMSPSFLPHRGTLTPAAQALSIVGGEPGTLANATTGSDVRAGRPSGNRTRVLLVGGILASIVGIASIFAITIRGSSSNAAPDGSAVVAAQPIASAAAVAPPAPVEAPTPSASASAQAPAAKATESSAPEPRAGTRAPQKRPDVARPARPAPGPGEKPSSVLGF